ncbi:MAG: PhzF family phenazine biosynthesis protein [Saprospiraceae bacterium]|nr:PhzF family phenazine biosynthesis protein [Saprospiraceae bacterium]
MKTYFVDSFTNQKFKGNPAAVCFPEITLEVPMMQSVANEIGFSETAFVEYISGDRYNIRFFTPKQEIPICGHATLAAAKIVFEITDLHQIVFINVNGVKLIVQKQLDKMTMLFPTYKLLDLEIPGEMINALGIKEVVSVRYNTELKIILIEMADCNALDQLKPDYSALLQSYQNINGVCVTAASQGTAFDFHYRFFWPWSGTHEDPVTGGVHTFLTPYWSAKLNQNHMRAFQSSERTGEMELKFEDDKVFITGQAVQVLEGNFNI